MLARATPPNENWVCSLLAAVDQVGMADEDSPGRLVIGSAGNLPLDVRNEYPHRNQVEGVENPERR